MPHPYERTPHLVALIGQAERLAAVLPTDADPSLLDAAAVATVVLDGSSLRDVPSPDDLLEGERRVDDLPSHEREPEEGDVSLWVDAMGFVHRSDSHVEALEYLGARTALASEDLGSALLTDPVPALAELHRRLTRGLVDPERAGEPRVTQQVVHDASVGRILYYPADPAQIPQRMAELGAWMVSTGAREHALIAAGVLQLEILRIHPFEAANGRLARTAARLLLRSRGLDPGGRCAFEAVIAEDALGHLDEVASTSRRKDVTVWLERWSEAVVEGLRRSARSTGVLDVTLPPLASEWIEDRAPDRFTVADYREGTATDTEEARLQLGLLMDAGHVTLVPGTRGLRYRRVVPISG